MAVRRSQVAERAGVSPAVVSYVLNDGPRPVAPQTRAAVLKAVEELRYRPNRIARSLRANTTMTIGLVVPDMANPYFGELAGAIEQAAFARGYTVLIGNSVEDLERQTAYVQAFLQQQVDALILVPAHGALTCLPDLRESQRPWVLLDRTARGTGGAVRVRVDNRAGARVGTRHLLEHGRRRIGCLAGPQDVATTRERVAGWRDALRGAGQETAELVWHMPYGKRAAFEATREIFSARRRRPDALFVASDEQAIGVLRALAELDIDCPEDVAIVSFDGIEAGAYAYPGLTTMAQPFADLGNVAVDHLIDRISGADPEPPRKLPVSLVVRSSCGCAEQAGDRAPSARSQR